MESLDDWFKSKEKEIEQEIKDSRKFDNYLTEIFWDAENFAVWYKSGENEVISDSGSTYTKLAPYKTEAPKPNKIEKSYLGDWVGHKTGSIFIDFQNIIHTVINEEEEIILKGFMVDKETEEIELNERVYVNLNESKENDFYPKNVLLVNPTFDQKLLDIKTYVPFWKLPPSLYEDKKRTYLGYIGDIEVHWNAHLDRDEGLFFDQKYANVKISKLDVRFDDYVGPVRLDINEKIFSWISHPKNCKIIKFIE